ncbi:MAG: division/cell wall cluster transcriptional repressor MraZ [Neisseriaceae bacterium]
MFNGVQDVSIDRKGRLAIPTKFREILFSLRSPTLCATLKNRQYLLLYPEDNWAAVREALMNLPISGNRILQQFQQLVLGNMEKLQLDAAGRILIPPRLRNLLEFGLDKEVVLVGRADRLEIWGKVRWDQETNAILDMDPAILETELSQTNLRI